ncbi:MAG: glycosyltransferase family 39 protein [Deltaproteobacteria bacterium]|nr:glycosyltransferase family 39 protein [Deltaproteobacteria bacterium]
MRRPGGAGALAGLLVAAGLLRLVHLERVPNAAHDEGNWLLAAWDLYQGRPAELPPDARFVGILFARLLALSWRLGHPGFAWARAVPAVGSLVGIALAALALRRLHAPRASWVLAGTLGLHPWAVLWSRNVVSPYALSLALAALSTLAVAHAWERSPRWPRVARVLAGQLLALGFQFSPLAALPVAGCALYAARARRLGAWLRAPGTALALGLAALQVAPVALSASAVAARGSTRPSALADHLPARLFNYARTLLGALDGEATLRDFTGRELPPAGEALAALAVVTALVASRWRPPERHRALLDLAWCQLVTGALGLAVLLAPLRQWHLPSVDAERYGFVVLGPAALVFALASERVNAVWGALCVALAAQGSLRAARFFAGGGSPDRGVFTALGGGGSRRWKVCQEHEALPGLLVEAAWAAAGRRPAVLVVADYVFHPLHFANRHRHHTLVDASWQAIPEGGGTYVFVLWSPGVFAPGFAPRAMPEANARLRLELERGPWRDRRRVRVLVQPDGSPLLELWAATRSGSSGS